jgi:ABC-2 type transport system ATP-binding protein
LIKKIAVHGKTILLTTHYMYEADELSNRVVIINNGKIVCLDTPSNLKQSLNTQKIVRISVDGWDDGYSGDFAEQFGAQSIDVHRRYEDVFLRLKCNRNNISVADISNFLKGFGVTATQISFDMPSLEDVFIEKTGSSITEKEVIHAG